MLTGEGDSAYYVAYVDNRLVLLHFMSRNQVLSHGTQPVNVEIMAWGHGFPVVRSQAIV